jgi:hypothetical protein
MMGQCRVWHLAVTRSSLRLPLAGETMSFECSTSLRVCWCFFNVGIYDELLHS